ncbi:hypothetical protein ACU4GR_10360 (plasmid) [Methylobacterium oryzae CBMB20]
MSAPVSAGAVWRRVLPVWLGLMALLAVGCALAYAPLGDWNARAELSPSPPRRLASSPSCSCASFGPRP